MAITMHKRTYFVYPQLGEQNLNHSFLPFIIPSALKLDNMLFSLGNQLFRTGFTAT